MCRTSFHCWRTWKYSEVGKEMKSFKYRLNNREGWVLETFDNWRVSIKLIFACKFFSHRALRRKLTTKETTAFPQRYSDMEDPGLLYIVLSNKRQLKERFWILIPIDEWERCCCVGAIMERMQMDLSITSCYTSFGLKAL